VANGTGVTRNLLVFFLKFPLQKYVFAERQRLCGVIALLLVLMITEGHMSLEGNTQLINYM